MADPGTGAKPPIGKILVAAVVAIVVATGYFAGLSIYHADEGADTADLHQGTLPADHLVMHVRVASIDPSKEQAVLAIEPEPAGGMTGDQGYSAKEDLEFDIVTDDGTKTVKIKAGDPMVTTQVPISISGEVAEYPNDSYDGDVEIDADTPMTIDAESHIQAFTADMTMDDHSKPTEMTVNFSFSRARSIVIFAWFVYALIAVVALLAFSVTFGVAWLGFKLEFSMIGWVGALLFVLPAVRNALPGQPPIGTIGDFAVFFWAEIFVVLSLLFLIGTWFSRSKG